MVTKQEHDNGGWPPWLPPFLHSDAVTPERYNDVAPSTHRRRLGQYFTPPRVAAWMVQWAIWPGVRTVLDPAVGTGILLDAALSHPLGAGLAATGIDLDPAILHVCRHNMRAAGRTVSLHQADFLADHHTQRYDAIVCNPPYIRHRALRDREALYHRVEEHLGLRLNRFSNSYVLFILQIAQLLTNRGRAAIITPVDYLNANFGAAIKTFLLRENLVDGLLLFDRTQLVFDEANIAACVLLLRADREADAPIRFMHVASERELPLTTDAPSLSYIEHMPDALQPDDKWLGLFPREIAAPTLLSRAHVVTLKKLASVRRGIATGANDFFMLTEAQCKQYELASHEYRPCITKANQASYLSFGQADFDGLRHANEKVYLLDVGTDMSDGAQRYLAEGLQYGVDTRYLPRHRRPWYATEPRPPAPLWVNTFTRRQFRFVRNEAAVANLTAFHAIYPYIEDEAYWLLLAALLNTSFVAAKLRQQLRVYGSGLQKLEPLDVAALEIPNPDCISASRRNEIVEWHQRRCVAERTSQALAIEAAQQIERLLHD